MWILPPEAAKSTSHTSQTLDADFAAGGGKVCIQHTTLANCCRVPIYRARAVRGHKEKGNFMVFDNDNNRLELVADGFSFPTSLTFDEAGTAYIAESGLPFGGARPGGRI